MQSIHTLDLNFQNRNEAIAVYLIPHRKGAVLIETGPGSTIPALVEKLKQHGYSPEDITHVFITHIHLDHAGAAGWMASQGAKILVHPVGEPHMANPEKLLASAERIYQEKMEMLWGDFLPVPAGNLIPVKNHEVIKVGGLEITALHTPGHAEHHVSWLFEDTCFTGDIGGIRMPGVFYIRMPMVPPELHFEKWKKSLLLLKEADFSRIAPTHYGLYKDAQAHLRLALNILDENEDWMCLNFNEENSLEELRESYVKFLFDQGIRMGVSEETLKTSEVANPTWMGADGLSRYWNKYRKH